MSATGIGEIATAADDLVKLVATFLQDREPIRHARMMNRLVIILAIKCEKTNTPPATEVAFTCAQLAPAVQQAITTAVEDEIKAAQPSLSNLQNKISSMEITKDPTLAQDAQDFSKRISTVIVLTALKLGPNKAKAFCEAVLAGLTSVAPGTPVTQANVISNLIATLQKLAAIINNIFFIRIAAAAQYIYADIQNNRWDILLLIKQWSEAVASVKALKAEASTEAATVDPNLNADELQLATDLGTNAAQLAIFFGGADAALYVDAIISGVSNIDVTQTVTDNEIAIASFASAFDVAKMINFAPLVIALTICNNIYDEFASGGITLAELFTRIKAEKEKVTAAAAQVQA